MDEIGMVAFDLGGVLANLDLSGLTKEELLAFEICMRRRITLDPDLETFAREKIGEIFLKCYKLRFDAIDTLEMLKKKDKQISLWTNNIKELDFWLEQVGLLSYIPKDNVINSFYVGYDKPDLRYYSYALRRLGKSPSSVLFLDDNYLNVLGARKCLIRAWEFHDSDSLQEVVERKLAR